MTATHELGAAPEAILDLGEGVLEARTEIDPGLLERHGRPAAGSPGQAAPSSGSAATAFDIASGPAGRSGPGDPGALARIVTGLRVQQYEVIRKLGSGGMGHVFLARDTRLGRKVAIKFLHHVDRAYVERFLVEARTTARCSHDSIVVIHDVGEWEGVPFMVLEYLEGQSFRELLLGGRLAPARAVELAVPVVRALRHAHASNIIHRDLKPENVLLLASGGVKVLDFGIAKRFQDEEPVLDLANTLPAGEQATAATREGAIVGTLAYMAPEQWGQGTVDHRTDLFALGLMLYEMVAGRNPLAGLTVPQLLGIATQVDEPLPSVGTDVPDLPGDLEHLIDRCLAKQKADRFATAEELLTALEGLLPGHYGQRLPLAACPYPGLTAFQEADAGRFFGRTQEVARVVGRLRERPLVAVVGPSGVGKSSFVRAGLIPALKHSGEAWEVFVIRPGRSPLASLAGLLGPITHATGGPAGDPATDPEPLESRLRREPGTVGSLLRGRARNKSSRILLFVDQFEELYTLSPDADERRAFTACLAGMADDAAAPLRVLVSMRSDFLDRVAEDPAFVDELAGGLVFLQAPDRQALREALLGPLAPSGCRFESDDLVESMLDVLSSTPGALPLLQFAATKLWEARDSRRNLLTEQAYHEMSGVAGALATHAGEVHAGLSPAMQKLTRSILLRLVTADGTRALVEAQELRALAEDPAEVQRALDHLVQARLLVVHKSAEAEAVLVELVHESLITGWPTLKRWVDETRDDAAFLEQLRQAARQWDARGRPAGLLWRAEAMEEARRFRQRYTGRLAPLEGEFLEAVSSLATRTTRVWRVATVAALSVLLAIIGVGAVALLKIRAAERRAVDQAGAARRAERTVKEQLAVIQAKEAARLSASRAADQAGSLVRSKTVEIQKAEVELARKNRELELALKQAQEATARAEKASDQSQAEARRASEAARRIEELARAEREANAKLQALLQQESARLAAEQKRTAELRRRLAELKPATTLPP